MNHIKCENALANIITIVALNNTNIMITMINASDNILLLVLLTRAISVTVIPVYNIYMNEDWFLVESIL